jgi:hypothetical protein
MITDVRYSDRSLSIFDWSILFNIWKWILRCKIFFCIEHCISINSQSIWVEPLNVIQTSNLRLTSSPIVEKHRYWHLRLEFLKKVSFLN